MTFPFRGGTGAETKARHPESDPGRGTLIHLLAYARGSPRARNPPKRDRTEEGKTVDSLVA